MSEKRAVIVGGGISGLAGGYELSKRGWRVTVLERRPVLGGLARTEEVDGHPIEVYYHFICGGDDALLSLIDEVELAPRLHWKPCPTSYYVNGRLYPFTTPLDILRFAPLSVPERLRFGLHAAKCRRMTHWEHLEELTAEAWLRREVGDRAYEVVWEPLMRFKFGRYAGEISAPWIWHRLHRAAGSRANLLRPDSFGYLEGGSQTLMQALAAKIRGAGGEVRTSAEATGIVLRGGRAVAVQVGGEELAADLVVSAAPLPELVRLLPEEAGPWREELARVAFVGVACLYLGLSRDVVPSYWVNVNDPRVPLNGFIHYSHLNPAAWPGGGLVYVPLYMPTDDPRYTRPEGELSAELVAGLRVMVPDLAEEEIELARLSRDEYAQAITPRGFARRVPAIQGPVPGLCVLDSTQLYPSDRCLSGMIGLARQMAAGVGSGE